MIRESVVQLLLAALAGEVDEDAFEAIVSEASPEESRAAAMMLAQAARDRAVRPATISVLDLPIRALVAISAAFGIVSRWDGSLDPSRSLGACLKTIPADQASLATTWLRWSGLLPPEENADDEALPDS